MEFSSPKLKKFLIFFSKKRELAKPEKQKFLIFQEMQLSSPKIFLIFSPKKKKINIKFSLLEFFSSEFSIIIIRKNFYVVSDKLISLFFFNNRFTFF